MPMQNHITQSDREIRLNMLVLPEFVPGASSNTTENCSITGCSLVCVVPVIDALRSLIIANTDNSGEVHVKFSVLANFQAKKRPRQKPDEAFTTLLKQYIYYCGTPADGPGGPKK